mgnify:CR=1 FL=1
MREETWRAQGLCCADEGFHAEAELDDALRLSNLSCSISQLSGRELKDVGNAEDDRAAHVAHDWGFSDGFIHH